MKKLFKTVLVLFAFFSTWSCARQATYLDKNADMEDRVSDLIGRMTLEEKMDMLHGTPVTNTISLKGPARLGIPDFYVMHGPFGLKCININSDNVWTVGTYFPVSSAMAATFDDQAIEKLGAAIGAEIRAAGGHSNAGPAMNIIRDPRTGRSFEYFTEDPYLNSRIASANVRGQQQHIAAIVKHYACNNQEWLRGCINVDVSERALHEIYLPGFESVVRDADAKIVMSSYNRVNGFYSSENKYLLTDVLRDEFGFKGFVMSDWGGTHSTVLSAESGLDVEMPRPKWYGDKLLEAVKNGEVSEATINKMLANVLRVFYWTGGIDDDYHVDKSVIRSEEHLELARKVSSEAMVLLKNDNSILPLDPKVKKIAVIGPSGDYGVHFNGGVYHHSLLQGSGSANVPTLKENMVTPFQGLKANAPAGVEVNYAPGCYAESGYGLIPTKYLSNGKGHAFNVRYYRNSNFSGKPFKSEEADKASFKWSNTIDIPEENGVQPTKNFSVILNSVLKVPETGTYDFELRNISGKAELFIDGKLVAENLKGSKTFWHSTGEKYLKAGKEYPVEIRYVKSGNGGDLKLSWDYENKAYLEEAKKLAAASDAVVLTVGLTGNMGEVEGGDRLTMNLAPAQENLIREICKINSNTAVTIIAGSSVTMNNWLSSAPAVLFAWYPGEQGGNALADIIYGKVNPAGRLPMTFPASDDVYPEDYHPIEPQITYTDDVFVGYRYFDHFGKPILFPFGYGLSYTQFAYSDLNAEIIGKDGQKNVKLSVNVKNTGSRDGDEVVQIYVSDPECSVERAEKELKEFRRINLKAGETKTLEFTLPERAFSYWDEASSSWKLEGGSFIIKAGSSSKDIRETVSVSL